MRIGDLGGQPSTTSPTSNAGTITSFTGGVLKIQLADGSTVSGTVSNDTVIECAGSGQQSGEDQGDDDQSTTGTTQTTGDDDQSTTGTTQTTGDDDQGSDDQGSSGSCSSSNLTTGTTISAAELRISGGGNVWEKVELGS